MSEPLDQANPPLGWYILHDTLADTPHMVIHFKYVFRPRTEYSYEGKSVVGEYWVMTSGEHRNQTTYYYPINWIKDRQLKVPATDEEIALVTKAKLGLLVFNEQ